MCIDSAKCLRSRLSPRGCITIDGSSTNVSPYLSRRTNLTCVVDTGSTSLMQHPDMNKNRYSAHIAARSPIDLTRASMPIYARRSQALSQQPCRQLHSLRPQGTIEVIIHAPRQKLSSPHSAVSIASVMLMLRAIGMRSLQCRAPSGRAKLCSRRSRSPC